MIDHGLGPLFGSRAITGPVLVQYVKWHGLKIYLIGEEHFTNGSKSNAHESHVIELLCEYSKTHKTRCYTEFNAREMVYQVDSSTISTAKSPLCTYAHYWWNKRFPDSHRQVFADARKLAPYDLYTLITYPMSFAYQHFGDDMPSHVASVRKYSKIAEKEIYKHIASRDAAKVFLESLVLPDKDYPGWFVKLYRGIYETEDVPPAPLRDKMIVLQERSPVLFERLTAHINGYYSAWAVSPYTAAFVRIDALRNTANSKVLAEKNPDVRAVFDEMTTFLLDVFVLLDILLNMPDSKETVLVLSGANHSVNLARFFAPDAEIRFKYDKLGDIPAGDSRTETAYIPAKVPNVLRALNEWKRV
jgi:hypothetical protein